MGRATSFSLTVIQLLSVCIIQGVLAQGPFLDCSGNEQWWNFFRRCCTSPALPNGCECFDVTPGSDFTNTAFFLPECPAEVGVEFHLFTRANLNTSFVIKSHGGSIGLSPFMANKPVKLLTHGFMDRGLNAYTTKMKDVLLDYGDMNVIIVNWEEGAGGFNYYQASANVRTVGAMIAQLIYVFTEQHGVKLKDIHLIGHSLGAHVGGTAAKEIRRLKNELVGRVTGLDPAGVGFERYSENVRLDKGDASFVDVIHTDAEMGDLISFGSGIRISIGDVDFWPNGGHHQPSCPPFDGVILSMFDFESADTGVSICSHTRCMDYFTSSIRQCEFLSPDAKADCTMGYHTSSKCSGDYYPTTTEESPFC